MTIEKLPGARVPPEVTLARMVEVIHRDRQVFTPDSGCIVILYGAEGQPCISFSNMDRDALSFVAQYFDEFTRMLWRPSMRFGTLEKVRPPRPHQEAPHVVDEGGDAQAEDRSAAGPANWPPPKAPEDRA